MYIGLHSSSAFEGLESRTDCFAEKWKDHEVSGPEKQINLGPWTTYNDQLGKCKKECKKNPNCLSIDFGKGATKNYGECFHNYENPRKDNIQQKIARKDEYDAYIKTKTQECNHRCHGLDQRFEDNCKL